MSGKSDVSRFERFVFAVTRLIAMLVAVSAVAGIVVCALFLLGKFDKPTTVTYQDVKAALDTGRGEGPTTESSISLAKNKTGYSLPENLKPFFLGINHNALDNWLRDLKSDQQRDFLADLSAVIKTAEADGIEPVDIINKYKDLKLQKFSHSEFEKYEAVAAKGAAGAALFGLLFLLIIVALVLVLLAIERHTRNASAIPQRGAVDA